MPWTSSLNHQLRVIMIGMRHAAISKPWAQLSVTKGVAPSCCFTRASRASTSSQAGSFASARRFRVVVAGPGRTRGVLLPNQALMLSPGCTLVGLLYGPSDADSQREGENVSKTWIRSSRTVFYAALQLDLCFLVSYMPLANFTRQLHKLELHVCASSKQHAAAAESTHPLASAHATTRPMARLALSLPARWRGRICPAATTAAANAPPQGHHAPSRRLSSRTHRQGRRRRPAARVQVAVEPRTTL